LNPATDALAPRLAAACANLELRSETDADIEFLARVYASTRAQELAVVAWSDAEKQRFLRSQFDQQRSYYRAHYVGAEFLVLAQAGEPIGRLYVFRSQHEIRMMDIALLPEWRGRGIGGCLLRALLAEAAADDCRITLHVEPNNPARGWYERLGFRLIENRGVYLFLGWTPGAASG
jgi:ribosomal protein S18 acetylase RimI-like enzyme